MADVLVWDQAALDLFFKNPEGGVARDLARRAIAVESQAKILLNDSYPPASTPGKPPHKRTARLQTSISWVLGEDEISLYAAIGTNVIYGEYLELGTDRMAARPFLVPALAAAAL